MLAGEETKLGAIASLARRRVRSIVGISAQRKADVLVLPEWAIPPQQLAWLMGRAADREIVTIAGETPRVEADVYSNRLWTGIPIKDSDGHKECLVVPPREKRFLSPEEERQMRAGGATHAAADVLVPVYAWRGVRFASLSASSSPTSRRG